MTTSAGKFHFFKTLQFKMIFLSTFGIALLLLTLLFYIFPLYERQFVDSQKASVKATIEITYGLLEYYGQLAESKKITEAEAQDTVKALLHKIRYNKTDYFFVYNNKGISMVHPVNPNYEGTDRLGAKDANGKLNIKEMVDIAFGSDGEGYAEYAATKAKDGPPFGKISYVKAYKPWNWMIGTGVYKDVVEDSIRTFERNVLIGFLAVVLLVVAANLLYSLKFSKNIHVVVSTVRGLAQDVTSSISQLSQSGQQLSQSSAGVAGSLEETSASLEEVSSIIKTNSEHASQAAALSLESKHSAENGEKEISHLIDSMSEISASSKKIGQIIEVIDDIAFQTNLLALNAAVEAARAGDQGKGFAVVADAVRTLAQRSAVAAKDISVLIQESVDKIETGAKLADKSGDVLKNILTSVNKVATLNSEIASASNEQLSGIQQINQAMNQLDQGSQTNAASAEEISTTVTEISRNTQPVDAQLTNLPKLSAG